jgi:hypothetical protein
MPVTSYNLNRRGLLVGFVSLQVYPRNFEFVMHSSCLKVLSSTTNVESVLDVYPVSP